MLLRRTFTTPQTISRPHLPSFYGYFELKDHNCQLKWWHYIRICSMLYIHLFLPSSGCFREEQYEQSHHGSLTRYLGPGVKWLHWALLARHLSVTLRMAWRTVCADSCANSSVGPINQHFSQSSKLSVTLRMELRTVWAGSSTAVDRNWSKSSKSPPAFHSDWLHIKRPQSWPLIKDH